MTDRGDEIIAMMVHHTGKMAIRKFRANLLRKLLGPVTHARVRAAVAKALESSHPACNTRYYQCTFECRQPSGDLVARMDRPDRDHPDFDPRHSVVTYEAIGTSVQVAMAMLLTMRDDVICGPGASSVGVATKWAEIMRSGLAVRSLKDLAGTVCAAVVNRDYRCLKAVRYELAAEVWDIMKQNGLGLMAQHRINLSLPWESRSSARIAERNGTTFGTRKWLIESIGTIDGAPAEHLAVWDAPKGCTRHCILSHRGVYKTATYRKPRWSCPPLPDCYRTHPFDVEKMGKNYAELIPWVHVRFLVLLHNHHADAEAAFIQHK